MLHIWNAKYDDSLKRGLLKTLWANEKLWLNDKCVIKNNVYLQKMHLLSKNVHSKPFFV